MKNAFEYEDELAALREELATAQRGLANCKLALDAQTHNYGVTNLRLTAAEQRNAELEKRAADLSALPVIANALKEREDAIELLRQNMHHSRGGTRHAIEASTQKFLDSLCLKPTESGASE